MDEIISMIAEKVGIDTDTAQTAIGIILNFLQKEGPDDDVSKLFEALPGADALAGAAGGGGGLMGMMGGAMGAVSQLNSTGLDMGQIQSLSSVLLSTAKEKAGEDVVDNIIENIPGLSQFM